MSRPDGTCCDWPGCDHATEGEGWAVQLRCVHCLREQYMPAVMEVSAGIAPCVWCGCTSTPMRPDEYAAALTKARAAVGRECADDG